MKILRAVFVPFLYMIAGISFMLALILNFMVLLPIEKYYFLSIALGISVGSAILAAFINRHKGWRLHLSVMIWAIFFQPWPLYYLSIVIIYGVSLCRASIGIQ